MSIPAEALAPTEAVLDHVAAHGAPADVVCGIARTSDHRYSQEGCFTTGRTLANWAEEVNTEGVALCEDHDGPAVGVWQEAELVQAGPWVALWVAGWAAPGLLRPGWHGLSASWTVEEYVGMPLARSLVEVSVTPRPFDRAGCWAYLWPAQAAGPRPPLPP